MFDFIAIPFGYVFKLLNGVTGSYLISIILFSVILKLVLFPFSIKQQKNSQKQASLRPKENVIRKKYAGRNDRATLMKMNTEIQEMYQKENYSPFGGCLPMILQMVVLLAVWSVVRSPLTYAPTLSVEETSAVKKVVLEMAYDAGESDLYGTFLNQAVEGREELDEILESSDPNYSDYSEINTVSYILKNKERFYEYAEASEQFAELDRSAEEVVASLPVLEIGEGSGFNLGIKPSLDVLGSEKIGEKLLILIPIFSLITAYGGQALTRKFMYQPEQAEEVKNQMRMMNIFMPLFSLYISTIVPAAVGIYWMMSNVLSPVQQFALSKMFPIKEITPEEMREAERLYGGKQKKKKASGNTGTKRKSLVYDDDDEIENISVSPSTPSSFAKEKKPLKEKKSEENSIVEKAPLKDEEK